MIKKNLLVGFAAVLVVASGIFQILGMTRLTGIGMFGLAFLALVMFREQIILNKRLQNIKVGLTNNVNQVAGMRKLISWYGTQLLDYGGSTLRRVKGLSGELELTVPHSDKAQEPTSSKYDKSSSRKSSTRQLLRTGRAATPGVNNPNATETLMKVLDPDHKIVVGGVFKESLVDGLGVETQCWRPSQIMNLLQDRFPDYVVLDEAAFEQHYWQGVFSAAGTSQMAELVLAIRKCEESRVPVYLIKDYVSPAVNSQSLRATTAVQLPLNDEALAQAFGAELSPVLDRANSIALERKAQ